MKIFKDFFKSSQMLGLLAAMIWRTAGKAPLKKWVENGLEIIERKIKDSKTETDDVLLLPAISIVRRQFDLADLPDDQPLNWDMDE